MAQSSVTYLGDNSTQQFAFTKGYIARAHVFADIDGVSTSFTFINDTLIDIGTPLLTGTVLKVFRVTPRAPLTLTDFKDGSSIPAADLDRVLEQSMYVAQETDDAALNSILLDTDDKYDAKSKVIKDVAVGVASTDVIAKSQLDAAIVAAGNVVNPTAPETGFFLTATGVAAWAWQLYTHTIAKISDATAFGKTWLGLADAAAGRSSLGLGTTAILNTGVASGDIPLMDATGYPAADGSQITKIGSIFVEKAADETVNNSMTLQNDDDLVAAVAADETIYFRFYLRVNSNTAADIKFAITVPAGASLSWVCPVATDRDNTTSGDTEQFQTTTGIGVVAEIMGVVNNGGTAGNLQLQWAQITADASDTKILQNSYLMLWRR